MDPDARTTIQVRDGTGTVVATWVLPEGTRPDLGGVDALARLQLAARRLGWSIRLCTVCPRLGEVVDLAGLADVLGPGVEPKASGQTSTASVDRGASRGPHDRAATNGDLSARVPRVETGREAEDGEELGPEEVVVPGDAAP